MAIYNGLCRLHLYFFYRILSINPGILYQKNKSNTSMKLLGTTITTCDKQHVSERIKIYYRKHKTINGEKFNRFLILT